MINLEINGERVSLPCSSATVSDGYHTFSELYDHRVALFLAFLWYHCQNSFTWKARLHHDGSRFDGWFIVGSEIDGKQITYHLPDTMWDSCRFIQAYEQAPVAWDGHSSKDVVNRLLSLINETP